MAAKQESSYFVYPTNAQEKDQAYAVFHFAKENNITRPQYIDADGTVWRWDNKGGGKHDGHRLIRTTIKAARNARDRARRVDLSLTKDDFEQAWPGRGAELFNAEQQRLQALYDSRPDGSDVDHYWSLNSGGFHVSNNLRHHPSEQNRSEGDRGAPHPLEQAAYMLAETKADQVRMEGPHMSPGSSTSLTFQNGRAILNYISDRTNAIQNGIDLFMFGKTGEETVNQAAEYVPGLRADPETDIGKRVGDAITSGVSNGVKVLYERGKAAVDYNGISSI